MSIELLNKAFKTKYPPTTKILLIALADYANEDGVAFPSYKTLMDKTSIKSKDTIAKHLNILEKDGVITRERRFNDSSFYTIFRGKSEIRYSPISSDTNHHDPKEKIKKRFKEPTFEDVQNYCKEKNYHIKYADGFIDFYASKGWRVGNQKMVSWKHSLSRWITRNGGTQDGREELIFA